MTSPDLPRYAFRVYWSETDGEYTAHCEELPQVSAGGPSATAALAEVLIALKATVQVMRQHGDPLPAPLRER